MVEGRDYEITESSPGLWRWVVLHHNLMPRGLPSAFVCFDSKSNAAEDFAIHVDGSLDETGRWVLPKEHLRNMVHAITAPCEECKDHHFGGVYWHERDPEGCNWSVSMLRGPGGHEACMACVQPAAIQLRLRYAIADER